jgi:hypothetical protein
LRNTADILAGYSEAGIAAKLADDYSFNGFDDWFLPSSGGVFIGHWLVIKQCRTRRREVKDIDTPATNDDFNNPED